MRRCDKVVGLATTRLFSDVPRSQSLRPTPTPPFTTNSEDSTPTLDSKLQAPHRTTRYQTGKSRWLHFTSSRQARLRVVAGQPHLYPGLGQAQFPRKRPLGGTTPQNPKPDDIEHKDAINSVPLCVTKKCDGKTRATTGKGRGSSGQSPHRNRATTLQFYQKFVVTKTEGDAWSRELRACEARRHSLLILREKTVLGVPRRTRQHPSSTRNTVLPKKLLKTRRDRLDIHGCERARLIGISKSHPTNGVQREIA